MTLPGIIVPGRNRHDAGILQYKLHGDAAFLFVEKFGRQLAEMDRFHINTAGRLTKAAIRNLESNILRPQERGSRSHYRLTGSLTGHSGRTRSIKGNALNLGSTPSGGRRQGKGVGWPQVALLDRRARHWRRLEYGTGPFKMPKGVFIDTGAGDVFYTGREAKAEGLNNEGRGRDFRSAGAATSGWAKGIEAKHFLRDAWDEVVGPDGRVVANKYGQIINRTYQGFQRR